MKACARWSKRTLGREGVRVVTAADGDERTEGDRRRTSIDVIALDHYMPGLDGLETLARIHAARSIRRSFFVTGAQDSRIAVAALKAGAFDYVIKDAPGEFVPLLFAAMQTAVEAMRLRARQGGRRAGGARGARPFRGAGRRTCSADARGQSPGRQQLAADRVAAHPAKQCGPSPEVKTALADATGRVLAVAQVHRRLYTSDDVQSVAVDQYLAALVEDLRRSATEAIRCRQLTLEADPVSVDPDRAVAVGVIVNEFVLNAIKYAYPEGQGPIRVS